MVYLHSYYSLDQAGAQGGNRTRTTFGQGILSPSRLPIPPLAPIFCTNDRPMSMSTDV